MQHDIIFQSSYQNLLRSEIAKEQSNNRTYANRNIFMFIFFLQ